MFLHMRNQYRDSLSAYLLTWGAAAAAAAALTGVPAAATGLGAPPLAPQRLAAGQLLAQAAAEAGLGHQGAAERGAGPRMAALRAGVLPAGQQLTAGVAAQRCGLVALQILERGLCAETWPKLRFSGA